MLKSYHAKGIIEAGCDEAGRGCLAGPVVAAAVILPDDFTHPLLNDSKTLTAKQRENLREEIMESAIDFAIGICDNHEIDEINILNASFLAMHKALDKLNRIPESILVDGNRFNKYKNIPHQCFVKGDGRYFSIAAASVLAKTERDLILERMHLEFPEYNWKKNKGYPTIEHRSAIAKNGATPYHRMSFTLIPPQMKFEF